jgi:uncharacterized protein (TIGR03437 family)
MVDPIAPALFTHNGNIAAALHGTTYQAVSTSSPAIPGETISLYGTGLGTVTLKNGLAVADNTPQVSIDGLPATVTWAGRAPGYQGLDQINVQIPAGVHHGTSVVVQLTTSAQGCISTACKTITRWSNGVLLPTN